jgi:DNA invertase Pin-like site-specific DNA recombinase
MEAAAHGRESQAMNVVLYLRMSTDKQDTSIPQQREALKRHADRQGYKIVGEYRDEGISGDATDKRKGFQKMLRDAGEGGIDRILCFDQDRFGRFDMIEAGYWITPLRDSGVSLETIAQGVVDWCDFAGRLTYAVAQEGKHQFLRDLSRNTLRGNLARAREGSGLCGSAAPYGYRRHTVVEGRRRTATLVVEPAEARVVKRIFETYAKAGGSLLAVGEMLNREKISSPNRKAPWHRNAVRRILRNPNYAGDYVWGRKVSGKYHVRVGDEVMPRRSPTAMVASNDPIIHRGMIPAIVSRETFEKAQELLDSRRKNTRRRGTVRPLSGLIFCAKCGSPMHVNFGDYRCSKSVDFGDGSRCTAAIARGDDVLGAVIQGLRQHVLAPARMAAVKDQLASLVEAEKKRAGTVDTKAIAREIDELSGQLSEGVKRLLIVPNSMVAELGQELDAVRARRDALIRERDSSKAHRGPRRLPIEKKVAECMAAAHGLADAVKGKSAEVLNEALRTLGVRIFFDGSTARVEVLSPLAERLPSTRAGRKPLENSGEATVAGTRNVQAGRWCTA